MGTNIVIDSKKGKWLVTKTKWATMFVRPQKDRWDERTTTVYREMWDVVKLGIIQPLTKMPHTEIYNWEVRYYKDCPPVRGETTKRQEPDWSGLAISYSDAIGIVLDAIGYPNDNAKLKEYLEV